MIYAPNYVCTFDFVPRKINGVFGADHMSRFNYIYSVIYHPSHHRKNMVQGLFKVGPVAVHTHPALLKIPSAPSAFPLLGAPQAPGNKLPPEVGKA